jgi:hypothetical protein
MIHHSGNTLLKYSFSSYKKSVIEAHKYFADILILFMKRSKKNQNDRHHQAICFVVNLNIQGYVIVHEYISIY